MDWTIGPLDYFLDIFWTTFWTIFWTFFSTILSKGPPPLVLREGWDAVYQYLGRGERQTVVTQGGVEDEWKEEGWEVVIGVNAIDWWSFYWIIHIFLSGFSTDWLTVKIFKLGCYAGLFFCHANLPPKHWTQIVIKSMANSQFLTSTIESCMCLLSRPVPVLNASHFPLGGQYIITEFIYLPLVIDFTRWQRSWNFWCLTLI